MICKIELLLFCYPLPSATPNLPCPSHSFRVTLSALENCGSSNLHPPLVMSNFKFKPLEMGFYTLNFSDGLPKTQGLGISPFEIPFGKSELWPNLFSGDAATQRLAASSETGIFGKGQWK